MPDRTVLLIEDEPDIIEVASASLELTMDWNVLAARSGADGVESAIRANPDAVILDVMMPGMDGPATLAALRSDERTRHIPVIFMTAKVQTHERERFEALGIDGIIPKPFDPMTLGDEIASILGWHG